MKRHMPLLFFVLTVALGACSRVEPPADAAGASNGDAPFQASPVAVTGWGPQTTTAGVAANPQPDGSTGMYFMLSRPVDGMEVAVLVDGQPLEGVAVDQATVTAQLPASRFATPGTHPVTLRVGSDETIEVGEFVVADALPASEEATQPDAQ